MKRKIFVKKLMAQHIPRNRAVAIAELVHAARMPYKNINVIGIRPGNTNYSVYITLDLKLLEQNDFKQRMDWLTEGIRHELKRVIEKNIVKRNKMLVYDPLRNRQWFNRGLDVDLPSRGRDIQATYEGDFACSDHKNFDFNAVEAQKYLDFKRNIWRR